jgi:hypothetical protein
MYNSETQVLLDILGAYRRQIIRSGKEYPTVVINDIFDSINHVLNAYNYDGKYAKDNNKSYK